MKDKKNAAAAVAFRPPSVSGFSGLSNGSGAFFLFPGGRQRKKIKNRSGRRNFRAVRGVIRV